MVYIQRMIIAALGALWIICYLPAIIAFHTPLNAAGVLAEITLIFLGILLVMFAVFFSIFYVGSRIWSAIDSRAKPSL